MILTAKVTKNIRKKLWFIAITALSFPLACREQPYDSASDTLVTRVDHTGAKRQSIGNCWLYAQATWLESIWLTTYGEKINVSESYWTWWQWYNQILNEKVNEIDITGNWPMAIDIIAQHGWVLEREFIASEDNQEISSRQAIALQYINEQLKPNGKLAPGKRTPEIIRQELDKAFGTNMSTAEGLARNAATSKIKTGKTQTLITVKQAMFGDDANGKWNIVIFPVSSGKDPAPTAIQEARQAVLRRAKQALNDHHPVIMGVRIDFNALDTRDATFKKSTLMAAGKGQQGGHMVVLSDYTAKNVPQVGFIGEGEVSSELKEAALNGELGVFKAKNSWGSFRPDRGITDGYNSFDYEYLTSQLNWQDIFGTREPSYNTALEYFVLPPGY